MAGRNKPNSTPDPRKVGDLKAKARATESKSQPTAGNTIESTLYGAQNDNQKAAGAGEFDA